MSNVFQVFGSSELHVDARSLKDNSDLLAQSAGIFCGVEAHDDGASACGEHQGREDAKHRRLATAIRAQQPKNFGRKYFETDAVQGLSITVTVTQILHGNHRWLG